MIEVMKQALDALDNLMYWDNSKPEYDEARKVITSLRQAIAELESQEPFGIWHQGATDEESDFYLYSQSGDVSCHNCIKLYTHPPQRKPSYKDFMEWAAKEGYDTAYAINSDNGRFIAHSPMTADLWKAWQAAHGIKENT